VVVCDFRIPKFKFSFGLETFHMLKELGVISPFSHGGLTNMIDSLVDQNLYVSNIFHKSFIEVNEEGSEAAAVTASVIYEECMHVPITRTNFVAYHPFLYEVEILCLFLRMVFWCDLNGVLS